MKTERTAVACFLILLNRVIKTVTCGYFLPLLANICLEKAWVEFTEKKGLVFHSRGTANANRVQMLGPKLGSSQSHLSRDLHSSRQLNKHILPFSSEVF